MKENIQTKWCDISIVKVQNLILKNALKDTNNQHFIWLSQACIPLKAFGYIYNYLNPHKSYFNKSHDSQVQGIKIKGLKYIKKAGMPSVLNRKHSTILVNNENMIDLFKNINICKEEIVYPSLLYNFSLENELELTPNLSANSIIFTAWPDMSNYKTFKSSTLTKNSPNCYSHISEQELKYLINSKSLFGRKFEENCTGLENLLDLLNVN